MDKQGPTPGAIKTLTVIGRLADSIMIDEARLRYEVSQARLQGASWRMISGCLGVSTQAAWEKYRDTRTGRLVGRQDDLFKEGDYPGKLP